MSRVRRRPAGREKRFTDVMNEDMKSVGGLDGGR